MPNEEKYVVSLRRHVFRAPHPLISVSVFVLVLLIFSYLVHPRLMDIFLLFFLPYVIVSFLDYASIKCLRIYFPLRRIANLNLVVFLISFVLFWIFRFFFSFQFSFFLAFAFPVYLRYMVYRTFLAEKKNFTMVVASYYNVTIFLISWFYLPSFPWAQFIIASVIYSVFSYLFIKSTTSIFRREFREDPLFFISSFLNYLGRFAKEDEKRLNRFFYEFYVDRKVPVSVMVFKGKEGIKGVFVAPYMHPGPFGEVGGSNIPNKLASILNMDNLIVFHTTTTHDNNIATDEDVEKIANAVKEMLNGKCEYSEFSDAKRGKIDGVKYFAQRFGDYAFISLLPENAQFDDVELNTGLAIIKAAKKELKDAMTIDSHNCFDENAVPLSLTPMDVMEIEKDLKSLKPDRKIKMGFSHVEFDGKSIGPGGIRAAVFEYGSKRIAYILMDGNNIKKGLRGKIRGEIKNVDEVELFSTDNHIVNMSMMDLNPVGQSDSWDSIVAACQEAVNHALENLEEVCMYMKTKYVELRMASAGNLKKMTSVTKESVSRAKIAALVSFTMGFLLSFLTFYFLR